VTLPRSVAIDFGASATKCAWRDDDGAVHLVRFGTSGQFDTVVYVETDLSISIYRAGGAQRALYGIKQRIGEPGKPLLEREIPIGAGDESVRLIEPTSAVLAYALARCRDAIGLGTDPLEMLDQLPIVLTHPVLWGDAERQFLTEALSQSAMPAQRRAAPTIHFVTEPEAACAYAISQGVASFAQGPIAVFDIGAATLDIAVVARDGDDTATLASNGSFSGGDDLDNALLRLVEGRLRAEEGPQAADAFLRACLEQPYSARAEARETKEALSADDESVFTATLAGDEPGDDGTNVDVEIGRGEFEDEIGPILGGWADLLDDCLASLPSGSTPGTILCSGGTALVPELQRQLGEVAERYGAQVVVVGPPEVGPGQCVAPGALDALATRENARICEEQRREREESDRREARERSLRRIRRHNEDMIDEIRTNYSALRARADALLDRLPPDEELIKVIRFKALKGFGVSSYLFDQWSLMALSRDRMTIEPVVGDGWWRCTEVESFQHGEVMNNMIIRFHRDRLWVGYITQQEYKFLSDWCNERF